MEASTIIEWFMKITLIISTYAFAYFVGYLIEEGDYALACLNAVSVISMMILFKKVFYDE